MVPQQASGGLAVRPVFDAGLAGAERSLGDAKQRSNGGARPRCEAVFLVEAAPSMRDACLGFTQCVR